MLKAILVLYLIGLHLTLSINRGKFHANIREYGWFAAITGTIIVALLSPFWVLYGAAKAFISD